MDHDCYEDILDDLASDMVDLSMIELEGVMQAQDEILDRAYDTLAAHLPEEVPGIPGALVTRLACRLVSMN